MMRKFMAVLAAMCVVAGQAFAGLSYTAVTKSEGGRGGDKQDMTMKAMIEGDKARMEFVESKNPMMKAGAYMLTKDAGKDLYMVDPKEKSYMKFDLEKMMGMAKGIMTMTFSDPKVEKTLDEAGTKILGYDTRHYKLRTTYKMNVTIMGMKTSTSVQREEEFWTTTHFKDLGLAAFAKAFQFRTGDKGVDDLMQATAKQMEGFPLKTIAVNTTTDANGKAETSKTTTEVTELKTDKVPADKFEIPADYTETSMPVPEGKPGKKGKKNADDAEIPPEAMELLKNLGGGK